MIAAAVFVNVMATHDPYTRSPRLLSNLSAVTDDQRDYIAGIIDTDGCIQVTKQLSTSISVTQALKGHGVLVYLYDVLGGKISKHLDETPKHQASYVWSIHTQDDVVTFASWIANRMTVKRREMRRIAEFPTQNLKVIPVVATHLESGSVRMFGSAKEAAELIGRSTLSVPSTTRGWEFKKMYSSAEIEAMRKLREDIRADLMRFHHTEHEPVDPSFVPSIPYVAGLIDGEGCLDVHGKQSQHHSIPQRWRPLPDMLMRHFGGRVNFIPSKDQFEWMIHSCDKADKLLENIEPYLVGKKAQACLINDMKPGEAEKVHAELRELKGNINRDARKIELTNAGESVKEFKRPPKELPVGVHRTPQQTSYYALIKVDYSLGVFDTIDEAKAQYDKYKAFAQEEKRTGKKLVDWDSFRTRTNAKNKPKADAKGERWIYATPSQTYQVKIHGVSCGTYATLEQAIEARDRELPAIDGKRKAEWIAEAQASDTKNIYPQKNSKGQTKYVVKIDGNNHGIFFDLEEAKRRRNQVLVQKYEEGRLRKLV